MEKRSNALRKRFYLLCFMALFTFACSSAALVSNAETVQAAARKSGWVEENGKKYYYQYGEKAKGWMILGGRWYFLNTKTGVLVQDQVISWKGKKYYLRPNGMMVTGWAKVRGNWYYAEKEGALYLGIVRYNGKTYYMKPKTGVMVTNKMVKVSGKAYYFGKDGIAPSGWFTYKGKNYYAQQDGSLKKGWLTLSDKTYYLGDDYTRKTGVQKIDTSEYWFDANGVMAVNTTVNGHYYNALGRYQTTQVQQTTNVPSSSSAASGQKTIKGMFLNALKPVGNTLYIWGGGHDFADSTRIGLNSNWKKWYQKFGSSYDYRNYLYRYGSGLDCSGFVSWSIYNTANTKSKKKQLEFCSYEAPETLEDYGWGDSVRCGYGKNSFQPGDVVASSGHVWIVMGQCTDGSVLLVHSTPPVVQISGTVSWSGSQKSEAIKLASAYMKTYYGNAYNKFKDKNGNLCTGGKSFITGVKRFRWDVSGRKLMSDPEGYQKMTPAQILQDLF